MIRTHIAAAVQRANDRAAQRHTIDLFAEFDASICRSGAPAAQAWREAKGWPRSAALQGIGGGLARIAFTSDGLYEPSDREGVGTPAIIIPCWAGEAPGRPDEPVDLLAWVPGGGLTASPHRARAPRWSSICPRSKPPPTC
jgi:hypothetical protein